MEEEEESVLWLPWALSFSICAVVHSVTRFGEISPLWQAYYFKYLAIFLRLATFWTYFVNFDDK